MIFTEDQAHALKEGIDDLLWPVAPPGSGFNLAFLAYSGTEPIAIRLVLYRMDPETGKKQLWDVVEVVPPDAWLRAYLDGRYFVLQGWADALRVALDTCVLPDRLQPNAMFRGFNEVAKATSRGGARATCARNLAKTWLGQKLSAADLRRLRQH